MKIFSGAKQLSPAAARNCLMMNLFATPGLGSLMGGRILAGVGQLILFLIGFVLIGYWFLKTMKGYYSLGGSLMGEDDIPEKISYSRFFLAGVLFAGAAWLWSLLTSLSLVRSAKTPEPLPPGSVPPVIRK
jgi:hypothetical protein